MHVPDISRFLSESSAGFLTFGSARMALLDLHSGFWGIRRQIEARVTVIDRTGTVLAESDRRPETMENHAGRPEVRAALAELAP